GQISDRPAVGAVVRLLGAGVGDGEGGRVGAALRLLPLEVEPADVDGEREEAEQHPSSEEDGDDHRHGSAVVDPPSSPAGEPVEYAARERAHPTHGDLLVEVRVSELPVRLMMAASGVTKVKWNVTVALASDPGAAGVGHATTTTERLFGSRSA